MTPFAPIADLFLQLIAFIDRFLVPLVFAIAFLVFIWGIYQYFIAGGASEEAKEKGKSLVIYGIIGFVLMFSVWGIVRIFTNSFGFNNQTRPGLPYFTTPAERGNNFGN